MVKHTDEIGQQHRPKLGEILVSKGYITEEDVDKVLSEQRMRLGEVLIKSDRITAEQLHNALNYQKKERLNGRRIIG